MPALCPIVCRGGRIFKKGKAQTMKKQYSNLEVIIDAARTDSEVRYNYETEQATVYARTEDDAERGIADLEARGVLQAAADPDDEDAEQAAQ